MAAPAIADSRSVGVEVPRAVAAALAEELALLSDGGRRVLEGAAVAGDPFEPELVAAAAGVTEMTAIEALDELLRSDLVRPTDVPRRFRFRHPLVRRAVYDSSPGGWRIGAHQRSAEALAARGASAAARAHHVERSAPHGDRAAVALLREAGDEAAQRTPAGAAHWFEPPCAFSARVRRPRTASSCSPRSPEHRRQRGSSTKRTRRCSRAWSCCRRIGRAGASDGGCAGVEQLLGGTGGARPPRGRAGSSSTTPLRRRPRR